VAHSTELERDIFFVAQNERHRLRPATAKTSIHRRNGYDLLAFGNESQKVFPGEILWDGVSNDLPDFALARFAIAFRHLLLSDISS
jgi:hypothetical protein